MQTVLIAGAGRSSSYLIQFMLQHARNQWEVVVMDTDRESIAEKINGHPKGIAAVIDVTDDAQRQPFVKRAAIVLSLLPPHLHLLIAKDCLLFKKNLITSSYVTPEMQALHEEARAAGLLFMCEMGLDPGIDHMSANSLIYGIRKISGMIHSFRSSCGALIAPESDDNPWHYKLSWNTQNVVNAGKMGAAWLENGKKHEIDYAEVFGHPKKIKSAEAGQFAAYPNRDSLKYLEKYDLEETRTFVRYTLRHPAFIRGWSHIVKAGLTDESDAFQTEKLTFADWVAEKCKLSNDSNLALHFQEKYGVEKKDMKLFIWLQLFENRLINLRGKQRSAAILKSLLEERWKMQATDRDMVVMQHQLEYERKNRLIKLVTTMVVKGEDRRYSAIAKTVGLPMAILAKKMLRGEINIQRITGVQIPVMPDIFVPVLKELAKNGVRFEEEFL